MNKIQKQTISLMARQSLKSGKLRNISVMITIILATALLSVILLFGIADHTVSKEKISHIQQAGFYNLTEEQLSALESAEEISYSMTVKTGTLSPQEDFDIIPYYVSELSDKIKIGTLESGRLPEQINEVAVAEGMIKKLNINTVVGSEFDMTFYDGTTEHLIISGILKSSDNTKQYAVFFSHEYAENGSQLKNSPYELYAKFYGAEQMNKNNCKEMIYNVGEKAGIEHKYINPTKAFLDMLTPDSQMIISVIIVGIVILLACILVIYGVFYISVIGRIRQFGQLRTIGMTENQIKKFVSREGGTLFIRSVPIGLLIGGTVGYIINHDGWRWFNTLWIFALVCALIYIITMISVHKPAKIASSVSPVEALHYTPQDDMKQASGKCECRNLTPLGMGIMNFSRNRKKAVSTLMSLGLGGILFITSATYISSFDRNRFARQGDFKEAEFVIGISPVAIELDENGLSGIQSKNPINEDFVEQIKAIDGVENVNEVKNFGVKFDFPQKEEYGNDDIIMLLSNEQTKTIDKYLDEGDADYDKLTSGNYILVAGNDIADEIYGWKFSVGDNLILHYYDGEKMSEKKIEVLGILSDKFNLKNEPEGWFVLPENAIDNWISYDSLNSKLLISVDSEKEIEAGEQLELLTAEQPKLYIETLQDRKQRYNEYANQIFGAISGLAIFIMMFSILSMVNMMITNIITKKQELAMLESIGMSMRQIRKMLLGESILLTGVTLVLTLTVGTLFGYILSTVLYNNGAFYMAFRFPTLFTVAYATILIIVPLIISSVCMHSFSKETLTERLTGTKC
ncbi:MAG: FtsX-like permease family protein [Ruminococcus sp.]|nr:FtsX-like permease family protein [Ruminococcus sp.]